MKKIFISRISVLETDHDGKGGDQKLDREVARVLFKDLGKMPAAYSSDHEATLSVIQYLSARGFEVISRTLEHKQGYETSVTLMGIPLSFAFHNHFPAHTICRAAVDAVLAAKHHQLSTEG